MEARVFSVDELDLLAYWTLSIVRYAKIAIQRHCQFNLYYPQSEKLDDARLRLERTSELVTSIL
jgi:hypothetical protein